MYLRDKEGRVRSLNCEAGEFVTELPMHGGRKELGTGLVNAIKNNWG
jgi:hypothetical protein